MARFLAYRDSFLNGLARVFDVGGRRGALWSVGKGYAQDERAIASDWNAVGLDIVAAAESSVETESSPK